MEKTPHKPRRTPWRDNIEALTTTMVIVAFLNYFILQAFKIPTGSMQPTLMGSKATAINDRLLVDKLSFHLRDPKRWEVAVFWYPLDRSKNFIKRLVGLPGEELRIALGDLWRRESPTDEWEILRRPRSVQLDTWKSLDNSPLLAGRPEGASAWRLEQDGADWELDAERIVARGNGRIRFGHGRGPITDNYTDGYPAGMLDGLEPCGNSNRNSVGDLRVTGKIRAEAGCTSLAVELEEGDRRYNFVIPGPAIAPAVAEDETPRIRVLGYPAEDEYPLKAHASPYRLPAGSWCSFAAQNFDDLLTLEIEGRIVCELEVRSATNSSSAVRLALTGEGAELKGLEVFRDIYYLEGKHTTQLSIPEGHYFAMGDNTQNSSDSREWLWDKLSVREADGTTRILRGNPSENPVAEVLHRQSGGLRRFRDEWGETWYLPTAQLGRPSREAAPLVPRELIIGRAVAVFWPVSISRRVWRPGWIH